MTEKGRSVSPWQWLDNGWLLAAMSMGSIVGPLGAPMGFMAGFGPTYDEANPLSDEAPDPITDPYTVGGEEFR